MVIGLLVALILRIGLTNTGFHDDVIFHASWGRWILENGMKGFYENTVWTYGWPNQPPIISFLYGQGMGFHQLLNTFMTNLGNFIALNHLGAGHIGWFYRFVIWFSAVKYPNTYFALGELISLKLIPIVGDLILAWVIYRLTQKKWTAVVYLFSPFAIFESAVWGQHDQIGFIFVLLAFWGLTRKKAQWWPSIFIAIAIGLKVTALVFLPLFGFIATKNKKTFMASIFGGIIAIGLYYWLVTNISNLSFMDFNLNLRKQIFAKGDWYTWVNSFNFWRIITPFATDSRIRFFGLRLAVWGYIMTAIVYLWGLYIARQKNWDSVLKAMFTVSFGSWFLMTSMHERYLYPALVIGLILCSKYSILRVPWLLFSLVFFINLYSAWNSNWFNNSLGILLAILMMLTVGFTTSKIINNDIGQLKGTKKGDKMRN